MANLIVDDQDQIHVTFNEYIPYQQYEDYELLHHKPSIEGVELVGDRTLDEFGMSSADLYDIHQLFS